MPVAEDMLNASVTDVAPLLASRELSVAALVQAQLARIEALDAGLHAFLHVTADLARAQARQADAEIAAGHYRGPLHGIPVGLMDVVATAGIPTTCASPLLRSDRPAQDAAIVERLTTAGAVCVGKLNLAEFAFDGHHPEFMPARNPWQPAGPGAAACSGSAAAVAAALCFGAVGSETGEALGSSAARCGVTGLAPGFGRISRHGVFPLAATLDRIGVLTRGVADAALMLAALAGRDERDPATRSDVPADYTAALRSGAQGLRVGIDRRYCSEDTEPAQYDASARACFMLRGQGIEIVDLDLDGLTLAGEHWLPICAVDALLHHRRWYPAQADAYGPAFRALLDYGAGVSAETYARAQRARQSVHALLERELQKVDAVLCPAVPGVAIPEVDGLPLAPAALPALLRFTAPDSLSGHPSLTLPNGFTGAGLPTAMRFTGRHGEEATLLRLGAAYQHATGWHRRHPVLA